MLLSSLRLFWYLFIPCMPNLGILLLIMPNGDNNLVPFLTEFKLKPDNYGMSIEWATPSSSPTAGKSVWQFASFEIFPSILRLIENLYFFSGIYGGLKLADILSSMLPWTRKRSWLAVITVYLDIGVKGFWINDISWAVVFSKSLSWLPLLERISVIEMFL